MIRATTGNAALISGGGADGYIDRVVTLCLERVVTSDVGSVSAQPSDPGARRNFDLAELIAWACSAAGVVSRMPERSDDLLTACRVRRTLLTVPTGLGLKGALLFTAHGGSVGLSLGRRGKAIVYSPASGLVVDGSMRRWVAAARIPDARGYR